MRRFLIDTDTASDDAVALVIALRHPDVHVEAITVVAGNVPLDQGVQNALYTVEMCGKQTPVYVGRHAPMLRELETAEFVHGQDGMGDIGLPLSGRQPAEGHAVDVIIETARRFAGELTLVTLGPLTNVAIALLREPQLAEWIPRCVIMGGTSDNVGNMNFAGEFNLFVDPEAARIVFESGMPITMVGWDISRKYAVFSPGEQEVWRQNERPLAKFCLEIQAVVDAYATSSSGISGFDLPDPIAMAVAIDDSLIETSDQRFVTIDCGGGQARGQTLIDHFNTSKRPQTVQVVTQASAEKFRKMLFASF
jgi:purine nucleosidase